MRTRVGVYALAVTDGCILLAQLGDRTPYAGRWSLPGGGMDHGEQPLETLHRELQEETGLVAIDPVLVHARSHGYSPSGEPFLSVQLIYRATMRGEPVIHEVDGSTVAVRWVPLSEAAGLPKVSLVDEALKLLVGGC